MAAGQSKTRNPHHLGGTSPTGMSVKRELIGIHKARFPTELFRCQATRSVKLRDYALQKNKAQFGLVLHAGLVVPQPAGSTVFRGV